MILPVANIDTAASFYARLLGMPGDRVSSGRHYFDCGGTILACYDALADGDAEQVGPNPQYVYFSVDDLDATHAHAREAGCRELTEIEVRPWGERSFYGQAPSTTPSASSIRRRSSPATGRQLDPLDQREHAFS